MNGEEWPVLVLCLHCGLMPPRHHYPSGRRCPWANENATNLAPEEGRVMTHLITALGGRE